MKPLTLSIIIPAYNEETYLKACLEAIACQTTQADEVIVVDNNSADATIRIAQSFPFVRVLHEKRQGLYFSRQTGMQAASGAILCRIDADTIVEPDWVAHIKHIFQDSTVQAVSGPLGYHDMPLARMARGITNVLFHIARAAHYDFLAGANMAIRRHTWQLVANELCNEPFLLEDIDITAHLKEHGIASSYAPQMKAMMSSRRFADKPWDFMRYIGGHTRTLAHHNQRSLGAYYAEGAYTLAYMGIKPLHMSFNPETRRFSLRHLLTPSIARPDPMSID